VTAPVRRPDSLGDARAGGPDPGASDRAPLGERLALRNWSLPVKLAAVLLVPTIFVITLGVLRIVEQTETARSYDGVQQAVALEGDSARLLAALDAERRGAAVFLAANRAGGFGPVQERVDDTSDKFARLRSTYESANSVDDQTRSSYRDAASAIGQLDRVRDDVRGGGVDPAGAISRYTDATSAVLTFDESLTREAADPSIAGLSNGLYALSVVREQDAYVQAVVASAIAGGRIDAPSIDQARNATLRRSIAVDEFRSAVGTDNAALADAVVGPDVDARDRLAQVVLGRGSAGLPLQVSAQDWDAASDAVQEKVTGVSDQLRERLQSNAASLQNGARNAAGVASVVLLLALMAGAAVVFFVTRSLLRPLRLLRRTALDVAERRLPAAVRSLREGEVPDTEVTRTPIETREEIGEVARAFDQVHEQAVRLAAEQAGLRTAFNSIFVNLSRRSQALVERQLRLIEQLENKEEDPEALAELFQLDHLATRMRRNSENLLVLSGTDVARRGGRPVPLVDVLRAAASEVEQYQRVELTAPPPVQLLGRTAGDVVHLVAELLENAAAFSAPETRVDVLARSEQDGAVVLEIADRGVGMTDEDLADANQRLGSPPTVDVSASRRMGLFVVGRLAIRHAIGVTLRAREDGGVVASVRVPASAVLSGGPGGRFGAAPSTRALGGTGLPVRTPGPSTPGPSTPGAQHANGSPRPETVQAETAGAPIPHQESREGVGVDARDGASRDGAGGGLPRRAASRGGAGAPGSRGAVAGAAGAVGAAGAASFFAPTVDPGSSGEGVPGPDGPTPPSGDGQETPQRNGLAGLASALPRRPARSTPPPFGGPGGTARPGDGPDGPPEPAPAEGGAPDEGDDDDDRVASVVEEDAGDQSVTVWSQSSGDADEDGDTAGPEARPDTAPDPRQGWQQFGPQPGAIPSRPAAAHAWRGPDGELVDEDANGTEALRAGDTDTDGPGGRHGLLAPPPGAPEGRGGPAPRPRPRPSEGWSPSEQGPPRPGARPGPPSHPGLPGMPARPGGFAGGSYPPGPRPAPWGPPRSGGEPPAEAETSGPGAPLPRRNGFGLAPTPPNGPRDDSTPDAPGAGPDAALTEAGPTEAAPMAAGPTEAAPMAVGRADAPADMSSTTDGASATTGFVTETGDHETGGHETGEAAGIPETSPAEVTDAPEETPASRPSRLSLRPLSQRRQTEAGSLLRPGSAPRLRPRPAQDSDAADEVVAEPEQSATGDELFASAEDSGAPSPTATEAPTGTAPDPLGPDRPGPDQAGPGQMGPGQMGPDQSRPDPLGPDRPGSGQVGAGYTNGHGSGLPGPARPGPAPAPRRPAAVLPNRERTPIFDEVASVWFREPEPNAPVGVDPEWDAAERPDFEAGAPSLAAVDAGTTEAGLPRRRPRAHLVPGSARPAPSSGRTAENGGPATPRRSADAIRGRLASYQRGVADGRSGRPAQPPDGDPADGVANRGPAHAAGPYTEEEEQ
jgi:signal transduction histidine kinase